MWTTSPRRAKNSRPRASSSPETRSTPGSATWLSSRIRTATTSCSTIATRPRTEPRSRARTSLEEMRIAIIDHLVLTVADPEATASFYERLGMRRETFGEGRLALHFGAQKLNLHRAGAE